jgi:nicotinate-nucleotide--dimethylbenzimidazole phosphoribosyltransferase
MKTFLIEKPDHFILQKIKQKIDNKTKPLGALGELENTALKTALIQQTLLPELRKPHIVVFAADHGIAESGVSAYPQAVTYQMVLNFVGGGAAINVFCRQNGIELKIVDAGVKGDFTGIPQVIDRKIAPGTRNFLHEPAMTPAQAEMCLTQGAGLVQEISRSGCNVIGFGEMGIANTSSAALLMSLFCRLPIEDCTGRGTGLTNEGLQDKIHTLKKALSQHKNTEDAIQIMTTFGGFEILQMTGAMLEAAENKMLVLTDGFIATAALLCAMQLNKNVLDYCIFCHQSDEVGHRKMLDFLGVKPLLNLGMRLGEGSGCAVAYPLIISAVAFLNEMASFESAGVSQT